MCRIKLSDAIREFAFEMQIRSYADKVVRTNTSKLNAFLIFQEERGKTYIDEVTTQDIKAFIAEYIRRGRKNVYINGILNAIRIMFNYLVDEQVITCEQHPGLRIKNLPKEKPKIIVFNDSEIQRMVKVFNGKGFLEVRDKLIIMLLSDTGIRCSELCKLRNADVTDTQIIIRYGKGRKQRSVYLSPTVKKAMLRYERTKRAYFEGKNYPEQEEYYFASYRGNKLTVEAVERVVKRAGTRAKVRPEVRCSPHTLRHWWAITSLRNGEDVYTLSRLLGHSSIATTQIYLESITDEEVIQKAIRTSPLGNLHR